MSAIWNWLRWRDEALDQVRFFPDRKAICRELDDHYEDHCKALERLGYDPELAGERTLAAMGDAREVGRALDKAHKPALGWLWEWSRGMLLVVLLAAAWTCFFAEGVQTLLARTEGQLQWTDPPVTAERVETDFSAVSLAPGAIREENGHILADLELWVEMKDPCSDRPGEFLWYLETTDDQGEIRREKRLEDGTLAETGYRMCTSFVEQSWTRYHYTYQLVLDHRPRWVEVRYPFGDWTLRAEWEAEP